MRGRYHQTNAADKEKHPAANASPTANVLAPVKSDDKDDQLWTVEIQMGPERSSAIVKAWQR